MTRLFSDRSDERERQRTGILRGVDRAGDIEGHGRTLISSENVESSFVLISLLFAPSLSIQLDIYLITLNIGSDEGCITVNQKPRR